MSEKSRDQLALGRRPIRSGLVGIADQSTIALTNLALTFFAAQGGVESLGSFALASAVYFAVLVLIRALVAEPYMALGAPKYDRFYNSVTVLSCGAGALVAGIVSLFIFHSAISWWLLPALVGCLSFYEFARIRAYVMGRPGVALAASLSALAVVCAGGLLDSDHGPDRWMRLAIYWLLAGLAGYSLILGSSGGIPTIHRGSWLWFRTHLFPRGKHLALDAAGTVLVAHVGLFLLGQIGSLGQVGAVRATSTLLSPVSLVFTGLTLSLTPVLARSDVAGRRKTLKSFWALVLATSMGAVVVVAFFGADLIRAFFGAAAVPSSETLIIAVASVVAFSLGAPLLAQVRVLGTYLPIAIIRLITGGAVILLMIIGADGDLGLIFFFGQFGQAVLVAATARAVLRRKPSHPTSLESYTLSGQSK